MDRVFLRKKETLRYFSEHHNLTTAMAFADHFGLTRQAVSKWGKRIPELTSRRILDAFPDARSFAVTTKPKPPARRSVGGRARG